MCRCCFSIDTLLFQGIKLLGKVKNLARDFQIFDTSMIQVRVPTTVLVVVLVSPFLFPSFYGRSLRSLRFGHRRGGEALRFGFGNPFVFFLGVNEPPVAMFALTGEGKRSKTQARPVLPPKKSRTPLGQNQGYMNLDLLTKK